MTIKNVTRVLLEREIRRAQGEDTNKNRGGDKVKLSSGSPVDRAHISTEAKEVNASHVNLTNYIDSAARAGKADNVEVIKGRIGSGYYDTPEVLEEIASSIIRSEGIVAKNNTSDRYEIFRDRVNNDFYDKKDVIEIVASRLLKFLK